MFSSVSHIVLLAELSAADVPALSRQKTIETNMLHGGCLTSKFVATNEGVPRGSIFNQLLFLVYINSNCLSETEAFLCTDARTLAADWLIISWTTK